MEKLPRVTLDGKRLQVRERSSNGDNGSITDHCVFGHSTQSASEAVCCECFPSPL